MARWEVPWAKWLSSTWMKRLVRICQWHIFSQTFYSHSTTRKQRGRIRNTWRIWWMRRMKIPFLRAGRHSCEFSVLLFSIFQLLSFYRGLFFSMYVCSMPLLVQSKIIFLIPSSRSKFLPKLLTSLLTELNCTTRASSNKSMFRCSKWEACGY